MQNIFSRCVQNYYRAMLPPFFHPRFENLVCTLDLQRICVVAATLQCSVVHVAKGCHHGYAPSQCGKCGTLKVCWVIKTGIITTVPFLPWFTGQGRKTWISSFLFQGPGNPTICQPTFSLSRDMSTTSDASHYTGRQTPVGWTPGPSPISSQIHIYFAQRDDEVNDLVWLKRLFSTWMQGNGICSLGWNLCMSFHIKSDNH